MSGPFADAALDYFELGWHPIPTAPPGKDKRKQPLVSGVTGREGKNATRAQVEQWTDSRLGSANVGLRLPETLIGIDVDDYGDKHGGEELRRLEAELGRLPDTIVSTSRDDGTSGIRLYRVPAGHEFPAKLGEAIEIVQRKHRFVMAAPSLHHTGSRYVWRNLSRGKVTGELDEIPAPADAANLPKAWLDHLLAGAKVRNTAPKAKLSDKATERWLKARNNSGGVMCAEMRRITTKAIFDLAEHGQGGAHDLAVSAALSVVNAARDGHSGCVTALASVRAAYLGATVYDRDAPRESAFGDWPGKVASAVRVVVGELNEVGAEPEESCWCELFAANGELAADDADDRAARLEKRAEHLEFEDEARALARSRRLAKEWEAPESEGTSLADQLEREYPAAEYFVEELAGCDANLMLVAQWKAGKTTIAFNLAKAAVDGVKFLDKFAVTLPPGPAGTAGNVAYFNFEVAEPQAVEWLREMGVDHPDRLYLQHFRGRVYPLPNEAVEDWTVEYLRARNVSVWFVDPLGAAYQGEENSNTDMREWLKALDQIKKRAGVSVLVVVVHTGSSAGESGGFKARGATRQMDWADVIWTYRHSGDGVDIPPDSKRFLRAYGRDVDAAELALDFDPLRRWMRVEEGGLSRSENKLVAMARKVVAAVAKSEGINTTKLTAALGKANQNDKYKAIEYAAENGWIRREDGKSNSKLHYLGTESPDIRVVLGRETEGDDE